MAAPDRDRLTVIIPTRQRVDTLASALRTCLTQDEDRLSILVSDNVSSDGTRDLVESLGDSRVRYINPGKRLGMSEHWEFALSRVEDGYVTFLGDDDGLMPGSATEVIDVFDSEGTDALVWPICTYFWPGHFDAGLANCLTFHLPQRGRHRRIRSHDALQKVASFKSNYRDLPGPYWGAIRRARLAQIGGPSGPVFRSMTPDVYSSIAIAAVTDSYIRTDRSMSIAGVSHHSNGASQLSDRSKDAASPTALFEAENGIAFHSDVDYAPNVAILVAECLLQARDALGEAVPAVDFLAMSKAAMRQRSYLMSPVIQETTAEALRATMARHGLGDELEPVLAAGARAKFRRLAGAALDHIFGDQLFIDCLKYGVEDVYGATLLLDRIRDERRPAGRRVGLAIRGSWVKLDRTIRSARGRGLL